MLFIKLLIMILVFSVVMVIMMKIMMKLTGNAIGKHVKNLHNNAEFLTETGSIPPLWMEKCKNMNFNKYKKFVKKNLKEMKRYFHAAPVFDSEETRNIVMDNLLKAEIRICEQSFYDNLVK